MSILLLSHLCRSWYEEIVQYASFCFCVSWRYRYRHMHINEKQQTADPCYWCSQSKSHKVACLITQLMMSQQRKMSQTCPVFCTAESYPVGCGLVWYHLDPSWWSLTEMKQRNLWMFTSYINVLCGFSYEKQPQCLQKNWDLLQNVFTLTWCIFSPRGKAFRSFLWKANESLFADFNSNWVGRGGLELNNPYTAHIDS